MNRLVFGLLVASLAGCSSSASPPASAVGSNAPAGLAGPSEGDTGQAPVIASQDGLTLTAEFDPAVVQPGGTAAVDVTIESARDVPTIINLETCHAPVTALGGLAIPWEPVGRTWDGLEGAFKQFALGQGLAPGGGSARLPYPTYARTDPCPQDPGETILEPHGSTFVRLLFTATLAGAVPALPGDVPVHLTVSYDRPDPLPTPNCNPICGLMQIPWKVLAANGTIRVAGGAPPIVSAGEALDGLLADQRFTNWLAEQPPTTWTNANLFLQNAGSLVCRVDVEAP